MIDNEKLVANFPKEVLQAYKTTHEERIRYITGLADNNETVVVRVISKVRGKTASISNEEIRSAVLASANRYPRYLGGEHHVEIDLTMIAERISEQYWKEGQARIKDIVDRRLTPAIEKKEVRHLSVFAFARIPFLAYLGRVIGEAVPLDIYQKQKTGDEGWAWIKDGEIQKFLLRKDREGTDRSKIAIVLSISGHVPIEHLPDRITDSFSIYSIAPQATQPSRNLLRTKGSFEEFKTTYERLLREVEANHPQAELVHVFPAVPIPVAIVIGRFMLPSVSPSLLVYEKGQRKFEPTILLESTPKG
jgi:hypothetical protein